MISTPKRPVPLEHHLWAGKEVHKIVNSKGEFLGQGWKDAADALRRKQDKEREAAGIAPPIRGAPQAAKRGAGRGGRGGSVAANAAVRGTGYFAPQRSSFKAMQSNDRQLWTHLVDHLRKKELLPVVVFSFSKKKCEDHAHSMPNTDLNTAKEKSEIHIVIERSITRLKGKPRASAGASMCYTDISNYRERQELASDRRYTGSVGSGNRCAPWRASADCERDGRVALLSGAGESAIRDRDLCYGRPRVLRSVCSKANLGTLGCEHACSNGRLCEH